MASIDAQLSPPVEKLLPRMYHASVATIPQKELRNDVSEVLRRAEGGEQIVVTVSGRPVAALGPIRNRQWVRTEDLDDLAALPPDPGLRQDLQDFEASLADPWAGRS